MDKDGHPTQKIIDQRRKANFITPIPKPKKHKRKATQQKLFADNTLTSEWHQYDPTSIINAFRQQVDAWWNLPNPADLQVTPETARLFQHWRRSFVDKYPRALES